MPLLLLSSYNYGNNLSVPGLSLLKYSEKNEIVKILVGSNNLSLLSTLLKS